MRIVLAALLAACAALPEHAVRQLKSKKTACSEANEGDEVVFDCGGEFISTIKFASYGQPSGACDSFTSKSSCHSKRTEAVIEDRCLGQTTCMFTVSSDLFGGDPCPSSSSTKKLAAVLLCGSSLTAEEPAAAPVAVRSRRGWKFIFLVFMLFGIYLTAGIAYNVRRMGATGLDAIPHVDMWKDLPFLVRDGIFFTVDTIKSKGKAQYQSVL